MTPPKRSARELAEALCAAVSAETDDCPGPVEGLVQDIIEALERAAEVEADNAKLSANQCLHDIHGDDHGNPYCPRIASLEEQLSIQCAKVKELIRVERENAEADLAARTAGAQRIASLEAQLKAAERRFEAVLREARGWAFAAKCRRGTVDEVGSTLEGVLAQLAAAQEHNRKDCDALADAYAAAQERQRVLCQLADQWRGTEEYQQKMDEVLAQVEDTDRRAEGAK